MTKEKIKKVFKVIVLCLLAVLAVVLICFWYINDGAYLIKKATYTDMEMIEEYTEIDFPDSTIIESFDIESDEDSFFWSHNEYMEVAVLIPNDEIIDLFPENLREYDEKEALKLCPDDSDEEFHYGVWLPRAVVKWFTKTQRTSYMTVMKSDDEYTRVYFAVDKLGWNKIVVR